MDNKSGELEQKRLAALERYRILDTEDEKAFDDMAKIAARICRVPMAVVSFIDSTRQWYKAKVGTDASEVPVEQTFCQYTIQSPSEVLAISDATLDARFSNHTLVKGEPGIRYYIGAPITTEDGHPIGTICAIDFTPREIAPEDVEALAALARQTISLLELRLYVLSLEKSAQKQKLIEEKLRDATKAKSSFLANMSHEIRTPLTSIIGFSEMLKNSETADQTESKEAADSIYRNTTHLLQLVNDILDFSKVEANEVQIELLDFSLKSLVADISSFVGVRAQANGVDFRIVLNEDVPASMHSDPTRLKQILFNLLGNALKFTKSGSITLTVERSGRDAIFSVRDTGIGISAEAQQNLFQPFMQAEESTTRKYGGTGLGLAISKKLSDLLRGTLTLDSLVDFGSCFTLTLPNTFLAGVDPVIKPLTQTSVQNASYSGMKILIAEDFEENRIFLRATMKKLGIDVTFAVNGIEAVDLASKGKFDLVFMDIQMPEMDGVTATRSLQEKGYKIPIIALTAAAEENIEKSLSDKGFSGYLGKPFSKQALVRILEKYSA